MGLVLSIDLLVVGVLLARGFSKGFERTLPLAAFLLMLFPVESQIVLSGLFDLTTQRVEIITLVVLYWTAPGQRRHEARTSRIPLKHLILLLVVWMTLATVTSVVPVISLKAVLSQSFDFLVTYYLFAKSVSSMESVHGILLALVEAMMVCSVFGVLESYYNWSVLTLFPPAAHRFTSLLDAVSDRGVRAQATFGHAILFGAALAMAIPMALYLAKMAETRTAKAVLWAGVLVMFLNLYKTGSRGPWIAGALSLVVMFVLGDRALRRYVGGIVLMSAITLMVDQGVWETVKDLYYETLDPDTAQGASYEWRYALQAVAQRELTKSGARMLVGYGPESFFYLGLEGEFQGSHVKYESCDSSVVQLMMETGYVGFGIVTILLLRAAVTAYRSCRKARSPTKAVCAVFLANICAFVFLMTNVQLFGWGQQSYMLWIVIALTMVYPRLVGGMKGVDGKSRVDDCATVGQSVRA
jgi:O-antigen ligase